MRWASTIQVGEGTEDAVRRAAEAVEASLRGARVDLVFAFASPRHAALFPAIPALLRQRFPGAAVVGAVSPGVLGGVSEIEAGPGLAVLAGHLPDVEVRVFHLEPARRGPDAAGWRALIGLDPLVAPALVLLPEPRGLDGEGPLAALDEAYPHSAKLGAVAGSTEEGQGALFADGFVHRRGTVGVALSGDVALHVAVAQGARAVGPAFVVTEGADHVIRGLDGRSAYAVLGEVFSAMPARDQALFRAGPILGVGPDVGTPPADLLVRNVVGVHAPSGAVAVAHAVRPGQAIRFFVRDADSARADLREQLGRVAPHGRARGALLFPCLGRGRRFFGAPDHDLGALRESWGDPPTAGLFGNGEIGPVRGQTHLHAFTATAGWFGTQDWS